jgi:hypothetical protein
MASAYLRIRYIPHLVALHLMFVAPPRIASEALSFIAGQLERLENRIRKALPQPWSEEYVEFAKLTAREKRRIEELAKARDTTKDRILFQVQKPS